MDILILQVFVSLLLVASSVILFAFTCRQRSFEHSDRLALLPMEDEMEHAMSDDTKDHRGGDAQAPHPNADGGTQEPEGTEK